MCIRPAASSRVSLAFVLAGTTSSLAADAQAFGERLKGLMAEQQVTLAYAGATSEGDDVLLSGATVRGSEPGEDAVALGDLRFENVTRLDAGRLAGPAPRPADIDRTDGPTRTRVSGIVVEGLQIPPCRRNRTGRGFSRCSSTARRWVR